MNEEEPERDRARQVEKTCSEEEEEEEEEESSFIARRRTLKASPKFTTQISILAFVPPFRLFSAKFTKSSLFAWTTSSRTLSVGLGPTGMKPLRPLGGDAVRGKGW